MISRSAPWRAVGRKSTRAEQAIGLAFLALAAALIGPALQEQAFVDLLRHSQACASGGQALAGPTTFLGHCSLCWAAAAAALIGLVLLARRRGAPVSA